METKGITGLLSKTSNSAGNSVISASNTGLPGSSLYAPTLSSRARSASRVQAHNRSISSDMNNTTTESSNNNSFIRNAASPLRNNRHKTPPKSPNNGNGNNKANIKGRSFSPSLSQTKRKQQSAAPPLPPPAPSATITDLSEAEKLKLHRVIEKLFEMTNRYETLQSETNQLKEDHKKEIENIYDKINGQILIIEDKLSLKDHYLSELQAKELTLTSIILLYQKKLKQLLDFTIPEMKHQNITLQQKVDGLTAEKQQLLLISDNDKTIINRLENQLKEANQNFHQSEHIKIPKLEALLQEEIKKTRQKETAQQELIMKNRFLSNEIRALQGKVIELNEKLTKQTLSSSFSLNNNQEKKDRRKNRDQDNHDGIIADRFEAEDEEDDEDEEEDNHLFEVSQRIEPNHRKASKKNDVSNHHHNHLQQRSEISSISGASDIFATNPPPTSLANAIPNGKERSHNPITLPPSNNKRATISNTRMSTNRSTGSTSRSVSRSRSQSIDSSYSQDEVEEKDSKRKIAEITKNNNNLLSVNGKSFNAAAPDTNNHSTILFKASSGDDDGAVADDDDISSIVKSHQRVEELLKKTSSSAYSQKNNNNINNNDNVSLENESHEFDAMFDTSNSFIKYEDDDNNEEGQHDAKEKKNIKKIEEDELIRQVNEKLMNRKQRDTSSSSNNNPNDYNSQKINETLKALEKQITNSTIKRRQSTMTASLGAVSRSLDSTFDWKKATNGPSLPSQSRNQQNEEMMNRLSSRINEFSMTNKRKSRSADHSPVILSNNEPLKASNPSFSNANRGSSKERKRRNVDADADEVTDQINRSGREDENRTNTGNGSSLSNKRQATTANRRSSAILTEQKKDRSTEEGIDERETSFNLNLSNSSILSDDNNKNKKENSMHISALKATDNDEDLNLSFDKEEDEGGGNEDEGKLKNNTNNILSSSSFKLDNNNKRIESIDEPRPKSQYQYALLSTMKGQATTNSNRSSIDSTRSDKDKNRQEKEEEIQSLDDIEDRPTMRVKVSNKPKQKSNENDDDEFNESWINNKKQEALRESYESDRKKQKQDNNNDSNHLKEKKSSFKSDNNPQPAITRRKSFKNTSQDKDDEIEIKSKPLKRSSVIENKEQQPQPQRPPLALTEKKKSSQSLKSIMTKSNDTTENNMITKTPKKTSSKQNLKQETASVNNTASKNSTKKNEKETGKKLHKKSDDRVDQGKDFHGNLDDFIGEDIQNTKQNKDASLEKKSLPKTSSSSSLKKKKDVLSPSIYNDSLFDLLDME